MNGPSTRVGRVLLVSYAYPPIAAPESWLAAKAARSLQLSGIEVDVVCATRAWWHGSDHSMVGYSRRSARSVQAIRSSWWLPFVQPHRAMRQFPDAMRILQRRTMALVESMDVESYDAMVTWSQWHSAHLVGRAVKRAHPGLRWVAHFSDPWVQNPLQPRHALARLANERMEESVLCEADVIEFTTPEALELTMTPHPPSWAERAIVIPHVIDDELFGARLHTDRSTLMVRHIGSFYGQRSPDTLFAGLLKLLRDEPAALRGVRIELVGTLERGMMLTSLARSLPPGLIHVRRPVPYLQSLELMRDADLLIVVDAPGQSNPFLASKVVDYIGARRPIVGLTPAGTAAQLIRGLGGWAADPVDSSAVAKALRAALDDVRARDADEDWGSEAMRFPFDRHVVGRQRRAVVLGDGDA